VNKNYRFCQCIY